MESSTDGEDVGAREARPMMQRWIDVARWMERHHPELFRRTLLAHEVTVAALSTVPEENNG